jgi:acyl-CoA thioesterase
MSIAIDIRRDPKGEMRLLMRSVMHVARNGRSDNDIKIINQKGEIVAIVHQANIAIPTSKRSKKDRKDGVPMSSL